MVSFPRKLGVIDLIYATFRSFFVEAFWNFERMQNLGCFYILLPIIRKLYKDKEKSKEILRQHLEFFNTHPYMASPLLGIIISLEEEAAINNNRNAKMILQTKSCMAGPFAALGDSFFWGTWRPFTAVIGVCLFFLNSDKDFIYWFAPLAFFGLYNFFHLIVQGLGIFFGYYYKSQLVNIICKINYLKIIFIVHLIGLFVLALTIFILLKGDAFSWNKKLLFGSSFALFVFLNQQGWSQKKLFFGLIIGSVFFSYFNLI